MKTMWKEICRLKWYIRLAIVLLFAFNVGLAFSNFVAGFNGMVATIMWLLVELYALMVADYRAMLNDTFKIHRELQERVWRRS